MTTLTLTTKRSYYPLFIIGLLSLFPLYKYVLQLFPSVITAQLMTEFHLTGAELGNLAATYYYSYLIMQIFAGFILDKWDLRRIIPSAIMICTLGVFLFAFAKNTLIACFARMLMGMGVAFAPIAYMKIAATYCPPRYHAFVNGLLATSSMTGAILGVGVLTEFVNHSGWRYSLFVIAMLGFCLALLCRFFIKIENPSTFTQKIEYNELFRIFRHKQNWWLFIYSGFAFSPLAIFGGLWGNPFLQRAYHLTTSQAASSISFIFIGLALGAPLLGMLSDYYNQRKKVMVLGTCSAFVFLCCILYVNTLSFELLNLCLFLFGLSLGCYMLAFTIAKEINPLVFTATVVTLINASEAILDSFTEPLIGKLLDLQWTGTVNHGAHYFSLQSYHAALWILPFYLFLALLSLCWICE